MKPYPDAILWQGMAKENQHSRPYNRQSDKLFLEFFFQVDVFPWCQFMVSPLARLGIRIRMKDFVSLWYLWISKSLLEAIVGRYSKDIPHLKGDQPRVVCAWTSTSHFQFVVLNVHQDSDKPAPQHFMNISLRRYNLQIIPEYTCVSLSCISQYTIHLVSRKTRSQAAWIFRWDEDGGVGKGRGVNKFHPKYPPLCIIGSKEGQYFSVRSRYYGDECTYSAARICTLVVWR